MKELEQELREAFNYSDKLTFEEFVIMHLESERKKTRLMSSDLAKAFSEIGSLKAKLNQK